MDLPNIPIEHLENTSLLSVRKELINTQAETVCDHDSTTENSFHKNRPVSNQSKIDNFYVKSINRVSLDQTDTKDQQESKQRSIEQRVSALEADNVILKADNAILKADNVAIKAAMQAMEGKIVT